MALEPRARRVPLTVSVAVEIDPLPRRATAPSGIFPDRKETMPTGAVLPEAAFTVATSCVVELCENDAGDAVAVVVVATDGAVTVTRTVAEDGAKAAFPA